jgi:hypothetical protein
MHQLFGLQCFVSIGGGVWKKLFHNNPINEEVFAENEMVLSVFIYRKK